MLIQRTQNTKEAGTVEFLVYKEGPSYVGVCLTFDIVEENSNPIALMRSIKEAAGLHIETVRKNKLSDTLLNRYAPTEYWEKYFVALKNAALHSNKNTDFLVASPYYPSLTAEFA